MLSRVPEDAQEVFFLAGESVEPGLYMRIDSGESVRMGCSDTLPASFDGRVACYTRVRHLSDVHPRLSAARRAAEGLPR